ncbi:MAG: caspase domain-containing protein, partial [Candidatus Bipolaricaulia bacterium]
RRPCRPESQVIACSARFGWPISIAILALYFCAVCSVMSGAQMASGNRWAIIVGVGRYGDPSMSGRSLKYSETDAQAVYDALTTMCQVPATNTTLLKGPKATKAGVEAALADVGRRAKPGDTMFLYFSGHGSYVADKDGDEADGDRLDEVLLPYDAVLGREDTYIIDDYLGWLVSRVGADSVAIIIDSCHGGGQGKSISAPGLLTKGAGDSVARDIFTDAGARTGVAFLAACQSGEVAFENADLGHGVLTFFVLQGIASSEADANGDGATSFAELGAFAEARVGAWCLENGIFQTPLYESPSNVPITLVPATKSAPPLVAAPPARPKPSPDTGRTASLWFSVSIPGLYLYSSVDFSVAFSFSQVQLELVYGPDAEALTAMLGVPFLRIDLTTLSLTASSSFSIDTGRTSLGGGARLSYEGAKLRLVLAGDMTVMYGGDYTRAEFWRGWIAVSGRVFRSLWLGVCLGHESNYELDVSGGSAYGGGGYWGVSLALLLPLGGR